jgi:hypothetical protein
MIHFTKNRKATLNSFSMRFMNLGRLLGLFKRLAKSLMLIVKMGDEIMRDIIDGTANELTLIQRAYLRILESLSNTHRKMRGENMSGDKDSGHGRGSERAGGETNRIDGINERGDTSSVGTDAPSYQHTAGKGSKDSGSSDSGESLSYGGD